MLSNELEKALNEQLNFELYSSYIYYSMAAALEAMNYSGAANWMQIQVQEELTHAQKFFEYINERDGRVILDAIEKPATEWASLLAVFENAYKHEKIVTSRVNNLMEQALSDKDHASATFLQWFVSEQMEEESNVKKVIDRLKLAADAPGALFMIDQELASRVFTPPAANQA